MYVGALQSGRGSLRTTSRVARAGTGSARSVASLGYHLVKQRKQLQKRSRLLPVELVSSPVSESTLRVELVNGRRIAVQAGFDAELLRRVVAVLER